MWKRITRYIEADLQENILRGDGKMDKKKDAVSAENIRDDKLILGGHKFNSRFILGSGKYNIGLIF